MLQAINECAQKVYRPDMKISDVIRAMLEELEAGEVQAMIQLPDSARAAPRS